MIVKRTLSPGKVLAYTRGPMTWTLAWALAATALAAVLGASAVAIPFAPVGALGAALAIFVAFRNNTAHQLLVHQSIAVKAGIRDGALGQFDPISLEPQLAALAAAQGALERLATTPTPRQYDYFTRLFVLAYAALVPFALLSLLPDSPWLVPPLALILAGVFVVMAVVGAANDEPMAGAVTDVPVHAICREIERDASDALNVDRPPALQPVDGYLW